MAVLEGQAFDTVFEVMSQIAEHVWPTGLQDQLSGKETSLQCPATLGETAALSGCGKLARSQGGQIWQPACRTEAPCHQTAIRQQCFGSSLL